LAQTILRGDEFWLARIKADRLHARCDRRTEPGEPPTSAAPSAAVPLIELDFSSGARLRISSACDPNLVVAVMKAMPRR
jgi:hypothetical protein